jgi:hypothetical protein
MRQQKQTPKPAGTGGRAKRHDVQSTNPQPQAIPTRRIRRQDTSVPASYRIEHTYVPNRERCLRGLRIAFSFKPFPPFDDPPPFPTPPAARRTRVPRPSAPDTKEAA